jgi:hypothetical protein
MPAGRPQKVNPSELYVLSQVLYWDFRRLAEGRYRLWHDLPKYERLISDSNEVVEYSPYEQAQLEEAVDQEIRNGQLDPARRRDRLRVLKHEESREIRKFIAEEESTKQIRVPGEPDVIKKLLSPDTTPQQVREQCKHAFMTGTDRSESEAREMAWPIAAGSILPDYLFRHAVEFTGAKHDPRFPRCDVSRRPTTLWKQLWFLSRALAGSELGVKTRTAINLVGSLRPEEFFAKSRAAKPKRRPKWINSRQGHS